MGLYHDNCNYSSGLKTNESHDELHDKIYDPRQQCAVNDLASILNANS